MKNYGLWIGFGVVVVGLIGLMLYFQAETNKVSKTLETERYSRLVAEEKVINTSARIRNLEKDLKASQDKISKVQSVLAEQKNINNDLERQFQKITKAKVQLEEQLKVAITQPPVVVAAPSEPVNSVEPVEAVESVLAENSQAVQTSQ